MSEWQIVGVLVTLFGFVAAIVTPLIKLNTTITKLTTIVDAVKDSIKELTTDNSESHRRLWLRNDEQDDAIAKHETRITLLEKKE